MRKVILFVLFIIVGISANDITFIISDLTRFNYENEKFVKSDVWSGYSFSIRKVNETYTFTDSDKSLNEGIEKNQNSFIIKFQKEILWQIMIDKKVAYVHIINVKSNNGPLLLRGKLTKISYLE